MVSLTLYSNLIFPGILLLSYLHDISILFQRKEHLLFCWIWNVLTLMSSRTPLGQTARIAERILWVFTAVRLPRCRDRCWSPFAEHLSFKFFNGLSLYKYGGKKKKRTIHTSLHRGESRWTYHPVNTEKETAKIHNLSLLS